MTASRIDILDIAVPLNTCEQCSNPIDRESTGYGPKIKYCSECLRKRRRKSYDDWAKRDINRTARNRYQHQNREKFALRHKLKKYGLTMKQYESLPKVCAVCGSTKELCFDHDHVSGLFRGFLCRLHNRVLGQLNDNPTEILALYRYIVSAPIGKPLDLSPVPCSCGCEEMMSVLDTRGIPMISLPGHNPKRKIFA